MAVPEAIQALTPRVEGPSAAQDGRSGALVQLDDQVREEAEHADDDAGQ